MNYLTSIYLWNLLGDNLGLLNWLLLDWALLRLLLFFVFFADLLPDWIFWEGFLIESNNTL